MKNILTYLTLSLILVGSVSCAPKMVSKIERFPLMYEEHPQSILILPPINETTAADAKDYYSTTIQEPLAFTGYYTFPYPLTMEIMKMEGLYDSELLANTSVEKFKEYFGTDAVLFTRIKKWDLSYMVLASFLTVSIDCELISTNSNQALWKYTGTVVVDLSGGDAGGSLAGLIIKAIIVAVNSAVADYVPYAQQANYLALATMPYGKYHALYDKDKDQKFVDQVKEETKVE